MYKSIKVYICEPVYFYVHVHGDLMLFMGLYMYSCVYAYIFAFGLNCMVIDCLYH